MMNIIDKFDRDDGPLGNDWIGASWAILNHLAINTYTGNPIAGRYYTQADVVAGVRITLAGTYKAGVVISLDDPSNPRNYVVLEIFHNGSSGRLKLIKVINSTEIVLLNITMPVWDGEWLELRKSGNTYSCYYTGSHYGTDQTITDTEIISNTAVGMYSNDATGAGAFGPFSVRCYGEHYALPDFSGLYSGVTFPTGKGSVSFRIDDFPAADPTVIAPMFDSLGMHAGFAVPRGWMKISGKGTLAQALAVRANGHEIQCHSFDHQANTVNSTFADFTRQVEEAGTEMRMLGLGDVCSFVQPGTWVNGWYFDSLDKLDNTPEGQLIQSYYLTSEMYVEDYIHCTYTDLPRTWRHGVNHITGDGLSQNQLFGLIDWILSGQYACELLFHSDVCNLSTLQALLTYTAVARDAGKIIVQAPTEQLFAQPA